LARSPDPIKLRLCTMGPRAVLTLVVPTTISAIAAAAPTTTHYSLIGCFLHDSQTLLPAAAWDVSGLSFEQCRARAAAQEAPWFLQENPQARGSLPTHDVAFLASHGAEVVASCGIGSINASSTSLFAFAGEGLADGARCGRLDRLGRDLGGQGAFAVYMSSAAPTLLVHRYMGEVARRRPDACHQLPAIVADTEAGMLNFAPCAWNEASARAFLLWP
jgi:hypothetical protein